MKNIVVVGSQWGDEGKGKIVDWLSEQADVVVRFQGGHNAGHTLVINGVTYKLRLLPSGIVRKNKISIIGNWVIVDPWTIWDEIEEIKLDTLETQDNNSVILKKPQDVYYEMWKNARIKAKNAKKEALAAFLEAKQIKENFMLENLDSDSDNNEDLEVLLQ